MQSEKIKPDQASVYEIGFWEGLQPDPLLTVSEWADEHRYMSPKGGAEAGKYKTARTPYAKEILDCLSPMSPIQEVVFMKGAQVGGSEIGLNWLGFIIDAAPGPTMAVQPTVDLAKRFSKQRLDSMIEETPRVRAKIKPARERDSGNTQLLKDFQAGVLLLTGANSAVGLRSMPAKNLFLDEIDAYDGDVDGEGDPIALARARTRTFQTKKKILLVSTPTIEGRSKIAAAFAESDQRYFHLPCPQCGQYQKLKMTNLKWETDKPETAYYVCEFNGCVIEEHNKTKMLSAGKWIAENPGASMGKIAGFHLSSLYSPIGWMSWVEVASEWIKAQKSVDLLRSFVNTVLGQTWKEKGEAPDWRRLYERRELYKINQVPDGVYFITSGTDIQKDRLETQIVGWGPDREAWVIDYRVFMGNPEDRGPSGPWVPHDQMLREVWTRPDGRVMSIRMAAIDTGYLTQFAYDYVRKYPPNRVIATKGFDHQQTTIGNPSTVDVNLHGKRIKRGMRLWPVGSSHAKGELYAVLKIDKPTEKELEESGGAYPPGFVHFPELAEEYFKQLTAEEIQTRVVKGFRRYEWVKVYERNEALDTFILARAAASVIGIDRFSDEHWANILLDLGPIETKEQPATDVERKGPDGPGGIKRRKSTFL